jgi:hypothetical protein
MLSITRSQLRLFMQAVVLLKAFNVEGHRTMVGWSRAREQRAYVANSPSKIRIQSQVSLWVYFQRLARIEFLGLLDLREPDRGNPW